MKRCALFFVLAGVVLLAALSEALPQQLVPSSDLESKPTLPVPAPQKLEADANKDDYDELHSPYIEPKAADPLLDIKPQTGSLISLAEGQDIVPEIKPDHLAPPLVPEKPMVTLSDASSQSITTGTTPNEVQNHYPVISDKAIADTVIMNETLAAVPVADPNKQDLNGIQPPPVVFDHSDFTHPMEVLTPLVDPQPCDPERILQVSVPAAVYDNTANVPTLPRRYGCSDYNDISREKASPAITWSNVSDDVIDFSVQMIDLGAKCTGTGPNAGRIHWHISGIKKAASVTLQEGASRDSRLLYGGKEEVNQWLEEYYGGPCPEPGETGCYRIKVLAHRSNGQCQCGHQDFLFSRPAPPLNDIERTPWTYKGPELAPPGKAKQ